jgi:hypothetical protein
VVFKLLLFIAIFTVCVAILNKRRSLLYGKIIALCCPSSSIAKSTRSAARISKREIAAKSVPEENKLYFIRL